MTIYLMRTCLLTTSCLAIPCENLPAGRRESGNFNGFRISRCGPKFIVPDW